MSLKRKLQVDQEDSVPVQHRPMKQLKISSFNFPVAQSQDVAMLDASLSPPSTSATSIGSNDFSYPTFNLYPFPSYGAGHIDMDVSMDASSSNCVDSRTSSNASQITSNIGLMQPKESFVHNFSNCSQIPRLRVACEVGMSGNRSLWTQCDECGAIEMVEITDS